MIFWNTLYTTIHSNIWNAPIPVHSPRLEPRKLRDSWKLNWSNVVFLISTLSENVKLKNDSPEFILTRAPSTTIGVVLVQGRRQWEERIPENRPTVREYIRFVGQLKHTPALLPLPVFRALCNYRIDSGHWNKNPGGIEYFSRYVIVASGWYSWQPSWL